MVKFVRSVKNLWVVFSLNKIIGRVRIFSNQVGGVVGNYLRCQEAFRGAGVIIVIRAAGVTAFAEVGSCSFVIM